MKKIIYILLMLGFVTISCNKSPEAPEVQDVVFQASTNTTGFKASACDNPIANFALIEIDGTTHQVDVFYLNNKIYTNTLKLSPGEHTIDMFVLVNDGGIPDDPTNNIIVHASPIDGYEFANFVNKPMPFDFSVNPFYKAEVPIELLCYEPADYEEFGFTWFSVEEIVVREFCFFGDICIDDYMTYTGSLYENQRNGLQHDMSAIFKIDVIRNGDTLISYDNAEWYGEGRPLCINYPDYSNYTDNYQFVLSILLKVGETFEYVEVYTWETTDAEPLPNIGEDNVLDFVMGDCVPDADLILPPPGDPTPDPEPTVFDLCFVGNICIDDLVKNDYTGSAYDGATTLDEYMPAIFSIDIINNGQAVATYQNDILIEDGKLCFSYTDLPNVVENFEFVLNILVIDGTTFEYKPFNTYTSADSEALVGEDNMAINFNGDGVLDFVLGDCQTGDLEIPPYTNPNPPADPEPTVLDICFIGDLCVDDLVANDYSTSDYDGWTALDNTMPALFKIDVLHNNQPLGSYSNSSLSETEELCLSYTDYPNTTDNFEFTLSVLVIDGTSFIYKPFKTWNTTDDEVLPNIGTDNSMYFVIGDCETGDINIPPYTNPNPPTDPDPSPITGDETAFAYGGPDYAICFLDDPDAPDNSRWGWTNGLYSTSSSQTYSMELWAGAADCDPSKGVYVGTVTFTYRGGTANVKYNIIDGVNLDAVHLYIGSDKYPLNGITSTVAPGKFTFIDDDASDGIDTEIEISGLSGQVYVIAHADVSGN